MIKNNSRSKDVNPLWIILTGIIFIIVGIIGGGTGGSLMAGLAGILLIILGLVAGFIDTVKRRKASNKPQPAWKKRRSWRVTQVLYWLTVITATLILWFSTDYYGNYETVGWGFLVLFLCLPGYIVVGKLFSYIVTDPDASRVDK